MSPEPTGVHGLLKQRKLFTHKFKITVLSISYFSLKLNFFKTIKRLFFDEIQKFKTIKRLFFDYQKVIFDYQKVIFRALWITLEPLYFTGFQELSTCQNLSISI